MTDKKAPKKIATPGRKTPRRLAKADMEELKQHMETYRIEKIKLEEGDVILVSSDRALYLSERRHIREVFTRIFGEKQKVVIADSGMQVSITKKSEE